MLMSMSILNDTVKLLSNINNGTNTLVINNTIVPESSWVGTGYYTVGNIRIAKIAANSGNVHCVKVNDLNYKLVIKTNTSVIWAENVNYDNTVSGSAEDNVQGAIDDLYDKLDDMHPVGSVFLTVNNTNPSTYFGGTWERIAKGRALVGLDENDTDFDSAEETGGSKTVNLNHSHSLSAHTHGMNSHTHGLNGHSHGLGAAYGEINFTPSNSGVYLRYKSTAGWTPNYVQIAGAASESSTHPTQYYGMIIGGTTDGAASTAKTATPSNNNSEGPSKDYTDSKLSSSQSVIQPYFTVYIWKRTA